MSSKHGLIVGKVDCDNDNIDELQQRLDVLESLEEGMDLFKARDLKHQFLEVFKHTEDPFDNIIQSVEFVEDEHLIETKPAVEFF